MAEWTVVATKSLPISVETPPESEAWVVVATAKLSVSVEEVAPPEVVGWVVVATAKLSIDVGVAVGDFANLKVTYKAA